MRRKLLAAAHPDQGGDHLLFLWVQQLLDHVAGDHIEPRREPPPSRKTEAKTDRIPFYGDSDFDEITRRAVAYGYTLSAPYGAILARLRGCYAPVQHTKRHRRGASYRQLAYIAHLSGLSPEQRRLWYRIAEELSLSDAHAGHVIEAIKGGR